MVTNFNSVEIFGICASAIILLSMCFRSTSIKGNCYMRIINIIGSLLFILYGCLIPAYSTVILNIAVTCINIYHLIKMHKDKKVVDKSNQINYNIDK